MGFITRLHLLFEAWKDSWISPLEDGETAMGLEPLPLQGSYQLWVSLRGTKLLWLSGHRTRVDAEEALLPLIAWASRLETTEPATHALELALLRQVGDFPARPPSERIQEEIRQRIKRHDPRVLIVQALTYLDVRESWFVDAEPYWDGIVPDAQTMERLRAINHLKVWLQLQALQPTSKRAEEDSSPVPNMGQQRRAEE